MTLHESYDTRTLHFNPSYLFQTQHLKDRTWNKCRNRIQSLKQQGREELGMYDLFSSLYHYSFNGSLMFNVLINE